ncbi:major facilitator super transporter protein [Ciborinia camelliae]|nr:major facilitator super transporter protein [Ciborinia camelliae]
MTSRIRNSLLVGANVLIPIAILIFASGFFPYKPFLSGLAQYDSLDYGAPPEAPFDKIIFMVVDALRSDFVYSNNSGFQFTQSLISNGAALPFTAHATSPTITMPRIKAITTGSIPSFLDVILNFAESDTSSSLATQDTWLAQMKAKGEGKMVMYGDDTWLKLFPETFDRADGTSSFFVSDFTEVDNNVTRHVPEELMKDDWNTMVLHYLGLDHIGHKAGPRSPNMIPKQQEMDGIVRLIYENMETKDYLRSTLLVLCGDHGMNDAGNHGGSAPGETSPALVFMSPKLKGLERERQRFEAPAPFEEEFQYYKTVEQSDIAPTLGALLGFPVPRNNLGAFIDDFLPFWPNENDRIQILLRNAKQILSVVTATFPSFENDGPSENCHALSSGVDDLACQWRSITQNLAGLEANEKNRQAWFTAVTKWLKEAQELMSGTASDYDVKKLITGQSFAALTLVMAAVAAGPFILDHFKASIPLLAISLLYGIMMFATSYVEEEQHFWYWTSTGWLFLLSVKSIRRQSRELWLLIISSIFVLAATRITRRWNQTGQKFAGDPDIARTFFSQHRLTLWTLVGATYLWNLQSLASRGFSRFPQIVAGAISTLLITAAITFKLAFTNEDSPELLAGLAKTMADSDTGIPLVIRARLVFIGIASCLLYTILSSFGPPTKRINVPMRTIHDLLILFLITQTRATNIPLILIFELQFSLLSTLNLSLIEITTTTLLLQQASFFALGNSNAISSIDLSSAYNGVDSYNVIAVGLLVFMSNWAGPLYFTSAGNLLLLKYWKRDNVKRKNVWGNHITLLTVFIASSLTATMVACTVLRTHLFIWTVFSPKFLYTMAWSAGMHLGGNVLIGGGLWWLGRVIG